MPNDNARELRPTEALRQGAQNAAIAFLRSHPALRFIVGVIGGLLFVFGGIAAPYWDVPLFAWLKVGQVAFVCLTGGLGALGLWHVAGRVPVSANSEGVRRSDLVTQLRQLAELHATGDLTDEEFRKAKAKILA